MPIRYYDHALGRERIKRRYVWAFYAFITGTVLGIMAGHVL